MAMVTPSAVWARSMRSRTSRNPPASLLARSSTSWMRCPRWSALDWMRAACARRAGAPAPGSCSLAPTMMLSGVRNSWLTVERKRLFNRVASSARRRPSSASRRSRALRNADASWRVIAAQGPRLAASKATYPRATPSTSRGSSASWNPSSAGYAPAGGNARVGKRGPSRAPGALQATGSSRSSSKKKTRP